MGDGMEQTSKRQTLIIIIFQNVMTSFVGKKKNEKSSIKYDLYV